MFIRYLFVSGGILFCLSGLQGFASDRETRASRNVLLQNFLNQRGLQARPDLQVLERTPFSDSTESVRLALPIAPSVPSFRLFLRSPKNISGLKKAVLIIPGMATQVEKLVGLAPPMEQTVLIAFDFYLPWTASPKEFADKIAPTPLQIALSLAWIQKTYGTPISVVSVSLGTFFHPISIGLFQRWRGQVDSHVFAFGGADFVEIAKSFNQPEETLSILRAHSVLTQFVDPRFFLPTLKGRSLFLEAENDEIFSLQSRTSYFQELPEPKSRISLPGGHISQNQPWAVFSALQRIFQFLEISPEK